MPRAPSMKQMEDSFATTSCRPLGAVLDISRCSEREIATALLIIGEQENDCHDAIAEYRFGRARSLHQAARIKRLEVDCGGLAFEHIGECVGTAWRKQNAVAVVAGGERLAS